MKNQKLLDALKTIKKECKSHNGICDDCPLLNGDPNSDKPWCLLYTEYPDNWHPWDWITRNISKDIDMDRDYGGY